jgi:hypothetical protein
MYIWLVFVLSLSFMNSYFLVTPNTFVASFGVPHNLPRRIHVCAAAALTLLENSTSTAFEVMTET